MEFAILHKVKIDMNIETPAGCQSCAFRRLQAARPLKASNIRNVAKINKKARGSEHLIQASNRSSKFTRIQ